MDSLAGGNMPHTSEVEPSESEINVTERSRGNGIQKLWLARISKEKKAHKDYRKRARQVAEIYQNDLSGQDLLYVPLYWVVINVQHVGVYSNNPTPDVRPRNESQNPLYRAISTVIERGLSYCTDQQSFDNNFNRAVDDFLGVSLGVPRVKVNSVINTTHYSTPIWGQNPLTGEPIQVGTRPEVEETVGDQTIDWEYVPWNRFGWEPGNSWEHCSWIYFRHRMTRAQMRKRFGKNVKASKDSKDKGSTDSWKKDTWDVFEIWDKEKREVLFIAKGEDEPLEIHADPLELKDFYPCPPPMMWNLPSDELIPVPDYDYIEHYDMELNRLQERRMALLEQIKAAGAYDPGLPELKGMLEQEDGQYIPVKNLISRLSAANLTPEKMLMHLPIMEKAQVLDQLNNNIQFVRSQVDEIMGISDIVMGTTKASETATAQEIKGRWVGIRLTRKREVVQYTVREMMRIMAQLLASHITPENLGRMTQMEITEEMMGVLQNDMLMEFVVDIETDSTVAKDEFRERETKSEMMNAVGTFAQSVLPMVQSGQLPADASSAILKAALEPYARYDRGLDEALGQLPTTMEQVQGQQQQIDEMSQQLEQVTAEKDQWMAVAQQLQAMSTEATSKLKLAQAAKETAQKGKIIEETFTEHEQHGSHPKVGIPTDDMESGDLQRYDSETQRIAANAQMKNAGQQTNGTTN